jgi:hypothetical protein
MDMQFTHRCRSVCPGALVFPPYISRSGKIENIEASTASPQPHKKGRNTASKPRRVRDSDLLSHSRAYSTSAVVRASEARSNKLSRLSGHTAARHRFICFPTLAVWHKANPAFCP